MYAIPVMFLFTKQNMLTIEEPTFPVENVHGTGDKYADIAKQRFNKMIPNAVIWVGDTARFNKRTSEQNHREAGMLGTLY